MIKLNSLTAYGSGLLQGKAYRVLTAHLTQTLAPFKLSIPEWKLLGQLVEHGNLNPAKLAEHLAVEAPLVTSLLIELEKKKLVKRKDDPKDKRAKVVSITKKGERLIATIEPKVKDSMRALLHGTSIRDLFAYLKVLETIVRNG